MSNHLPGEVTIEIITSARASDLKVLYKSAGWWEPSHDKNPGFLNHIVQNSALFAGAFYKAEMIGMGRALSDSVSDAYIQDVTVLKAFEKKGVGKKIVNILVETLRANGVDWIGVVAQPGTALFYEKLGFGKLNNHTPLKYKG